MGVILACVCVGGRGGGSGLGELNANTQVLLLNKSGGGSFFRPVKVNFFGLVKQIGD